MPSSTSSSNSRLPAIRYRRLWGPALGLFLGLVGLGEYVHRRNGHQPMVVESMRFWALHRADVYTVRERKRLVIAGSSRGQLGLDPDVIESVLPRYRVKQLTIDGTPAFGIVRDLCEDPSFDGILLWDTSVPNMFPSPRPRADVLWTRFYHEEFGRGREWEKNINAWLAARLQSRLVTLSPDLRLRSYVRQNFRPAVSYVNLQWNRHRPARYYEVMTAAERETHRRERVRIAVARTAQEIPPDAFFEFLDHQLVPLDQRLRSRGGRLVLLRMPTSDEHWAADNRHVPKEDFWDRIEERTGIPAIHFADHPELSGYTLPDTSHLDRSDVPEFSRRLARILAERLEPAPVAEGGPLGRPERD